MVHVRLAALELAVALAAEVELLEHVTEAVGVPGLVDRVEGRCAHLAADDEFGGVESAAVFAYLVGELLEFERQPLTLREDEQRRGVRQLPVVVEPLGVFERLHVRTVDGLAVDVLDGVHDGTPVGVGDIDEHAVDVQDDRVHLHTPPSVPPGNGPIGPWMRAVITAVAGRVDVVSGRRDGVVHAVGRRPARRCPRRTACRPEPSPASPGASSGRHRES